MTISDINVDEALERARQQLKEDQTVSPSLRAAIDVLMPLVKLMADRLATSSRNSSKPPCQDPHRQRRSRAEGERRPGGQPGHEGKTLAPVTDPDEVVSLRADRRQLAGWWQTLLATQLLQRGPNLVGPALQARPGGDGCHRDAALCAWRAGA